MDYWYSLAELHERFGLSRGYVLELVRAGQLRGRCMGRVWLVSQASLVGWRQAVTIPSMSTC